MAKTTGEPNGRPLLYKTPEEFTAKVDEYFKKGVRKRKIPVGGKLVDVPVPTITGLVLYLGFDSRQSFYDYGKREEFSYSLGRARTFIEREYEELLQTGLANAQFALKNMGWRDKQEIEHGATDKVQKLIDKGIELAEKYTPQSVKDEYAKDQD